MARVNDKKKALDMRKRGKSYSQIKNALGVSKGTLSYWLRDLPLKESDLRKLRDTNPRRIEAFRATMVKKREDRLKKVFEKAQKNIGKLSKRDMFIGGLFLYWGEGTKASLYRLEMTNTDPSMLRFFLRWLEIQNVDRLSVKVKLHLYSDMNIEYEEKYWSRELAISRKQFQKTQIKKTGSKSGVYKGRFGHGTCSVILDNRDMSEFTMKSLEHLQKVYK